MMTPLNTSAEYSRVLGNTVLGRAIGDSLPYTAEITIALICIVGVVGIGVAVIIAALDALD